MEPVAFGLVGVWALGYVGVGVLLVITVLLPPKKHDPKE